MVPEFLCRAKLYACECSVSSRNTSKSAASQFKTHAQSTHTRSRTVRHQCTQTKAMMVEVEWKLLIRKIIDQNSHKSVFQILLWANPELMM